MTRRLLSVAVAMMLASVLVVSAQAPPAPAPVVVKPPELTEVQKLTLTTKLQAMQLAGQQATPKAMSEAIAALIEQRQQAAQQAAQAAQETYQALSAVCGEAYALNVQTLVCDLKPKKDSPSLTEGDIR